MRQEDRNSQFERIKNGLKDIFSGINDEQAVTYTRNYIGMGPNYMYVCGSCNRLYKFIPDGRKREME
jgi:hypothetical protein